MDYRIQALGIGYLFGLILLGYWVSKFKKVDLQHVGSGNIGSTNTSRALGPGIGALNLLCDALKAVAAGIVIYYLFKDRAGDSIKLLMLYGCFGAMLGHIFPIYLKFKGGKGVATSLGLAALIFPQFIPISIVCFIIAVVVTKYVSLGSIIAVVTFGLQVSIATALNIYNEFSYFKLSDDDKLEANIIIWIAVILIVFLHRENIKRLINHEENKFTLKKSS